MLGTVIGAVPMVVKLIERIRGRKNGASKKSMALDWIKRALADFAGPGVGLPQDDEIGGWIDKVVADLNEQKALTGSDTVVAEGVRDAELVRIGLDMMQSGMALLKRGGV